MMEAFSSPAITKAAASTMETSSGIKATNKRKGSDDETTAYGNSEKKEQYERYYQHTSGQEKRDQTKETLTQFTRILFTKILFTR